MFFVYYDNNEATQKNTTHFVVVFCFRNNYYIRPEFFEYLNCFFAPCCFCILQVIVKSIHTVSLRRSTTSLHIEMAAMKTMMGVALDARPSMGASVSADGISKLNLGISIINYHIVQRQMASKTVEFSVSAFGNGKSNNYCFETDGSFPNVDTVCPMGRPSVDDLQRVEGISVGTDNAAAPADVADAMSVVLDTLKRVNAGKKFNRMMLLITDGDFIVSDMGRLESLVSDMRANDIALYVALLGRKDPESVSPIISENGKLLASMASVAGGAFSILDAVSDSFYFFAGRPGMTTRPMSYKIPFFISPTVQVGCTYWGKVSKATLPSLKKQSPSYDPSDPDSGGVKRITSYFNPDDPDEEVPFDEKVKGYRYGSQYVPVTAMDETALKLSSEPQIKLIGFLQENKIPRYHFMESTMVLQGDPQSEAAGKAISALAVALRQCNSVALVRFVKRKDSDPWLAALFPFPAGTMQTSLMIHRLPCAEDIRDFPFPSLYDKRYGAPNTTAQMKSVSDYVDDMTIHPDDVAVFNPAYPSLIEKVLGAVIPNPNPERPTIFNPLTGSKSVLKKAEPSLKRVLSNFSLEAVDRKKKKRKIYWSDYDLAATSEDASKQSVSVKTVIMENNRTIDFYFYLYSVFILL